MVDLQHVSIAWIVCSLLIGNVLSEQLAMHYPKDICTMSVAGCILHNLCVKTHENVDQYIVSQDNHLPNNYPNIFANSSDGFQRRNIWMHCFKCSMGFLVNVISMDICILISILQWCYTVVQIIHLAFVTTFFIFHSLKASTLHKMNYYENINMTLV